MGLHPRSQHPQLLLQRQRPCVRLCRTPSEANTPTPFQTAAEIAQKAPFHTASSWQDPLSAAVFHAPAVAGRNSASNSSHTTASSLPVLSSHGSTHSSATSSSDSAAGGAGILLSNVSFFWCPLVILAPAEESDADTMRGGRGGGNGSSLGLRMQLDRMGLGSGAVDKVQLVTHSSYFADVQQQQQMNVSSQAHPPLIRSASAGAVMSVPSLSLPVLNQQQQPSNAPASLPVRLPGTQFIV